MPGVWWNTTRPSGSMFGHLESQPRSRFGRASEMKTPALREERSNQIVRAVDGATRGASTGFLFDLDGTLVDSVYQHVLAWREALEKLGIDLAVWRIHRRIGMSGGLLVNALLREIGRRVTKKEAERLARLHGEAYSRMARQVRALPGAPE